MEIEQQSDLVAEPQFDLFFNNGDEERLEDGTLRVLSLFSGCGGMDLGVIGGFTYLGKEYGENPFDIVYSVDNDDYCTKIYNDNFDHKCIIKDVRNIEIDKLPQFDMLIGGFPCQSFSISAQNPPRLG